MLVREESILALEDDINQDKHNSVAHRILNNHEITEARVAHNTRAVKKQLQIAKTTLKEAQAVARGFQNEVENMNKNFAKRLNTILEKENAKRERKERIERELMQKEKERKEREYELQRRREERLLRRRHAPFNLQTVHRALTRAKSTRSIEESKSLTRRLSVSGQPCMAIMRPSV